MSTFTGNRGLDINEPLLFEIGNLERTGVEIPEIEDFENALGGLERSEPIGTPGLSEPETMRHFTRLSRKNFAIDMGIFPLGSCTMKHNPRLNEKIARIPGLSDIHPLQPVSTVQGSLGVMKELADWLIGLAWKMRATPGSLSWFPNRPTAPTRQPRRCAATRSNRFPSMTRDGWTWKRS